MTPSKGWGRRVKVTRTFDTKREALAFRDQLLRQQREGAVLGGGRGTVREELGRWLAGKALEVSPETMEMYRQHADHVKRHLGRARLDQVRRPAVQQLYVDLSAGGMSRALLAKVAVTVKSFFADAVGLGLLVSNPADLGKRKPKARRPEVRPLDRGQVKALLEAAQVRAACWYGLIVLALDSGARQGELFGLRWQDVDLGAGRIAIRRSLAERGTTLRFKEPKSEAGRRSIAIAPATCALLASLRGARGPGDLVFSDRKGGPLRKSNFFQRVWKPLLQQAGLAGIRFHDLRHTSASWLLSEGVSIRAVAARLGHANPAITLRVYAHVMPADDARVVQTVQRLLAADPSLSLSHGCPTGPGVGLCLPEPRPA
jgi:integrase